MIQDAMIQLSKKLLKTTKNHITKNQENQT